jgi:hypothetical protein
MHKTLFSLIFALLFLAWPFSPAFGQELIAEKRIYVDHGDYADVDNPQCHVRGQDDATTLALDLFQGKIPSVPKTVGIIVELALPEVQHLIAGTGGDIGKLFAPNRYATCGTVALLLAPGTTNIDIKGFTDEGDCPQRDGAFFKCRAGWSAWTWSRQGDYIVATFKNWSHNRARNATLRVYGIKPPVWPRTHIVVKGECLSKIAEAAYGKQDWPKVYRANRTIVSDPDLIYVGQKLTLSAP